MSATKVGLCFRNCCKTFVSYQVCANDQGSTISGYLHKKTGKSWKRDWFVVKDKVLYEYKASEVSSLIYTPIMLFILFY